MKTTFALLLAFITGLLTCTIMAAPAKDDFPHEVQFELGDAEFAKGDSVTITEVRGTKPTFVANETYAVTGTYTLNSRDEAELALFLTVSNSGRIKIDPKQRVRITKGTGKFRLIATMHAEGYPHVSFYPVPSGDSFGGVYFGHGQWLLRDKGWSTLDKQPNPSGANQAIFNYLGEPVAPSPDMDPAYSPEGLKKAVTQAAQKAGVNIKSVHIDDSEFPFLVGVVSSGKFDALADELKKTEKYDFTGSVGTETHHAFNIVPWPVFPSESSQRIGRRLTVRYQILFDKISSH